MDILVSLNKPKDITSQDAVTNVKKILKVKKAGHTGTLDPMATGLMMVCLNKATRLASYFSDLDKEYKAVMKLGETTDTQDAYGKIIERSDCLDIDKRTIKDSLKSFEGRILQQPPMFSALKHKGKPLYKYAREGVEVERKQREVVIRHIEISSIDPPYAAFKVLCSKGTYIRTLCHDIGKKLGVGAHLHELQRTAIGPFRTEESLTLEDLLAISQGEQIGKGIYSMDEALSWLPEFMIEDSLLRAVVNGNPVRLNNREPSEEIRCAVGIRIKASDGALLAIGSYLSVKNVIKMDVVF